MEGEDWGNRKAAAQVGKTCGKSKSSCGWSGGPNILTLRGNPKLIGDMIYIK